MSNLKAERFLAWLRRAVSRPDPQRLTGDEAVDATTFWADLPDYHLSNDGDPIAVERSRWLARDILPPLNISSLLEVGTNSGRNLAIIRETYPDLRLRGIDVNPRAIEFARAKGMDIDFAVADANNWRESEWDAVLTMSVLDHIPDEAAEALAGNIAKSAQFVIAVELWNGTHETPGLYKYSRNTEEMFGRHGFRTMRWEVAPSQYDTENSLLWVYVGQSQQWLPT